jgi:hypothetical protein
VATPALGWAFAAIFAAFNVLWVRYRLLLREQPGPPSSSDQTRPTVAAADQMILRFRTARKAAAPSPRPSSDWDPNTEQRGRDQPRGERVHGGPAEEQKRPPRCEEKRQREEHVGKEMDQEPRAQ